MLPFVGQGLNSLLNWYIESVYSDQKKRLTAVLLGIIVMTLLSILLLCIWQNFKEMTQEMNVQVYILLYFLLLLLITSEHFLFISLLYIMVFGLQILFYMEVSLSGYYISPICILLCTPLPFNNCSANTIGSRFIAGPI